MCVCAIQFVRLHKQFMGFFTLDNILNLHFRDRLRDVGEWLQKSSILSFVAIPSQFCV